MAVPLSPWLAKSLVPPRETGWHLWTGVNGLFYAQRLLSSPPKTVTGRTEGERDAAIAAAEAEAA